MPGVGRGGETAPLRHQEAIDGDAECRMVVEAAPAAAFEVAQAEFLFQFLIIALDNPSLLGQSGQVSQLDILRRIRQPVFARSGFAARPLDQRPLLLSRWMKLVVAMCSTDAYAGKTGAQGMLCALPPHNVFPGFWRQFQGQLFHRYRRMLRIAAHAVRRPAAAAFPRYRWQRLCPPAARPWWCSEYPARSPTADRPQPHGSPCRCRKLDRPTQATIGPALVIAGSTSSRTQPNSDASLQGASATT